jgi:diguanylate cyclase (GGDEF)-like protein
MDKKHIKVLLIEDSPGDARLIKEMLMEADASRFELEHVDKLSTGLKRLGKEGFDVLLLDLGLPDSNGIQTLEKVLTQATELPVIVLTGLADEKVGIKAVQGGAQDYLAKGPVDSNLLIRSIRYAIERKKMEKALSWELGVNSAIADISSALLSEQSFLIDDITYLVLDHSRRLTRSRFGFVGYIDPNSGYMISPTMTRDIWDKCQVKDKSIVFKKLSGLWGWVLDNRQPLLTNTPSEDPRSCGIPPGHLPIRRFLSAPALIGGRLVGLIALANSDRNYMERDLNLITRMASFYAVALHRKRIEEELRTLSLRDELTGLYNRRGFFTLAQQQWKLAKRSKRGLLLIIADLDGLKKINDTFGHKGGDRALRDTANILEETYRESDVIGRIGGDEFAIVMLEDSKADTGILSSRLQDSLDVFNKKPDLLCELGISIGVARYDPESPCSIDELMSKADALMYEQKRSKQEDKI